MRRLGLSCARVLLFGLMLAPAIAFAAAAPAPVDEAQRAGRSEASFPQATEDFFHDMDNGAQLTADEVQGRNMWIVWTGGNDRFWDSVTKDSLATFDILKVITSHPSQTYCDGQHCDRDSRWHWLGAINEPCFEKPTAPTRSGSGFGSTCAAPIARPIRLRTRRSTPASNLARAGRRSRMVRACRSAPISATRPASSACASFPIRTSTRRQKTSGTPSATTPTRITTTIRISFGPTGSAWRAGSATSARAPSTRRPTRLTRNGPISIQQSAASIYGSTASSTTPAM